MTRSDDARRENAALCERLSAPNAAILQRFPASPLCYDPRVPIPCGSAQLMLVCLWDRTCFPDVA